MYYRSKIIYTGILFLCLFQLGFSQQVTFNELRHKMEEDPKPIILYITSDYCAYCSMQKKLLEKNKDIKKSLNEKYYFLTLNSQTKEKIEFNTQKFEKTQGIHQLALKYALQNGILVYPSWVFFDENYQQVYQYQGFIKAPEWKKILSLEK